MHATSVAHCVGHSHLGSRAKVATDDGAAMATMPVRTPDTNNSSVGHIGRRDRDPSAATTLQPARALLHRDSGLRQHGVVGEHEFHDVGFATGEAFVFANGEVAGQHRALRVNAG